MKRNLLLHRPLSACVALLTTVVVSGCGQRGPLTLPVRPADIPAPIAATNTPAIATEPASVPAPK